MACLKLFGSEKEWYHYSLEILAHKWTPKRIVPCSSSHFQTQTPLQSWGFGDWDELMWYTRGHIWECEVDAHHILWIDEDFAPAWPGFRRLPKAAAPVLLLPSHPGVTVAVDLGDLSPSVSTPSNSIHLHSLNCSGCPGLSWHGHVEASSADRLATHDGREEDLRNVPTKLRNTRSIQVIWDQGFIWLLIE